MVFVNYNASYKNFLLWKVDISASPMHDITLFIWFTFCLKINSIDWLKHIKISLKWTVRRCAEILQQKCYIIKNWWCSNWNVLPLGEDNNKLRVVNVWHYGGSIYIYKCSLHFCINIKQKKSINCFIVHKSINESWSYDLGA